MTHHDAMFSRTSDRTPSARADDVRAHERAQYATPPTYLPTEPEELNSSQVRQSGLVDARETGQTDTDTFLAVYSIGDNRLVRISSYAKSINAVMQQFRWATLERGTGWYFAEPYLARVELALIGVGVRLANRDGSPTPREAEALRKGERRHTGRVLEELAEAREAALADPAAVRAARQECRAAFTAASAAELEASR